MRSIWTGAIGFGLVNIPVKLYSATETSTLDLDMLDKKDHSHIRLMRVNEHSGKEVSWENIVKAYKYKDEYVVLSDEDFEAASVEKSKVITISGFAGEDEIDSIYFETPYYVEPEESGVKAYALLREALLKTEKVGIATFVMRSRENLAILRPTNSVIILNKIRFAEEIKDASALDLPSKTGIKKDELEMAVSLINQLSEKFDISAYKDTYTDSLLKIIAAKAKGAKPKKPHLKVVPTQSTDLVAQLRASLNARKKAS
ncbi:MAG: Ku protein [Methylobacter sp.]|uniref:non-homologous end joining protein Ku n=1 Tax=Methylobacter sp. TaxID=2051955 RepID=UPI0025F780D8|nr:Ku protein [Methylobacter sp.]MCK9622930.1 Ku protein [Methylobacter sp.]